MIKVKPQPTSCTCLQTAPGPARRTKYPSSPRPSRAPETRRQTRVIDRNMGTVRKSYQTLTSPRTQQERHIAECNEITKLPTNRVVLTCWFVMEMMGM